MWNLESPIPKAITDPEWLTELIKGIKVYPYYGADYQSSHMFLYFLYELYYLSGSQNAVIKGMVDYAFSGEMDLSDRGIEGFVSEKREIPYNEKVSFIERLESVGPKWSEYLTMTRQLCHHEKISGNFWLRAEKETLAGETKWHLEVIDSRNVMLLVTEPGTPKYAIISDQWERLFYQFTFSKGMSSINFEYEIVPLYPTIDSDITLFHHGNFIDRKKIYGRPDSMGSLTWQIIEYQIADLQSKISGTEIVSRHILAFQEEDPNTLDLNDGEEESELDNDSPDWNGATVPKRKKMTDFQSMMMDLQEITTQAGRSNNPGQDFRKKAVKGLAGIQYPHGGEPPRHFKLDLMRDTNYIKEMVNQATGYIYQSHGWSRQMTGITDAKSNLGGNILDDQNKWKYTTAIQPMQDKYSIFWQEVWKMMLGEKINYGIKYPNLIENMTWNEQKNTTDERRGENVEQTKRTLPDE